MTYDMGGYSIEIKNMIHQEIRTIEHKGVKVSIKIDYDEGTATLVEKIGTNWQGKQYLFKGRGLEYMNSWICILEAMQVAVEECRGRLEVDAEIKENRKVADAFKKAEFVQNIE